ncbi:Na(+)/H(+) antiporter subunit F1 [Paenibacillus septentrionalis]|uniref:Na(+)/H(+) antiporter subunit F1 n=1 Tax=Paenibacillus septentrionalis TaxID=429342 RepID=A0ABW1V6Y5_9BACL
MIDGLLTTALVLIALSLLGCIYRLLRGPSLSDRIASLDTLGICSLAMIAVVSLKFKTQAYFDVILVLGILTFIGTVALARYIERGIVLESGDETSDH